MGDKERAQKGSEISEVGETLDVLPAEGERRATSSNVFRMTTLGSWVLLFDMCPVGLLATELPISVLVTIGFSIRSSAYSGSVEKLSGITTTWYVPGLEASAFLSRSSSEVSRAKGGRESLGEK
jgi:hypothetical protein